MENKLKALFGFQEFQSNKRLAKMIAEAEQSMSCRLNDDELSFVAAAGETDIRNREGKNDGI